MNPKEQPELTAAISRELKALPELKAPAGLTALVLAIIESRANAPWHRRPWLTWPAGLQAASLIVLLAICAGGYAAGWELLRTPATTHAVQQTSHWFSGLNTVGTVLQLLGGALALVIKQLGTTCIIAGLVAAGLAYTICMGLGTFYFRLMFAKR